MKPTLSMPMNDIQGEQCKKSDPGSGRLKKFMAPMTQRVPIGALWMPLARGTMIAAWAQCLLSLAGCPQQASRPSQER